jgi:hypothetical protein
MNYSELFITIVAGLTVGSITLALHWLDNRLRRVERKLRFKREERSVGDKDFDNWL